MPLLRDALKMAGLATYADLQKASLQLQTQTMMVDTLRTQIAREQKTTDALFFVASNTPPGAEVVPAGGHVHHITLRMNEMVIMPFPVDPDSRVVSALRERLLGAMLRSLSLKVVETCSGAFTRAFNHHDAGGEIVGENTQQGAGGAPVGTGGADRPAADDTVSGSTADDGEGGSEQAVLRVGTDVPPQQVPRLELKDVFGHHVKRQQS